MDDLIRNLTFEWYAKQVADPDYDQPLNDFLVTMGVGVSDLPGPQAEELSREAFMACLVFDTEQRVIRPLWLAGNKEFRRELMTRMEEAYREWVEFELEAMLKREKSTDSFVHISRGGA